MSITTVVPERDPLLPYTAEVERLTAPLYPKLARIIPAAEWAIHAPYIAAIAEWKQRRNAVVLAHNYQTPEIFHGVADIVGDSLGLAADAARTDADVIVLAGVHFMAETAKLLSPEKTVLIPDLAAGCSLAESITAADIRLLRESYPGVPVVTYVNTSAAVKAESDICCTSANASRRRIAGRSARDLSPTATLPATWRARRRSRSSPGRRCEVHERFRGEIRAYRDGHPGIMVLAHPECPPDVLAEADFVGSTSGMAAYVEKNAGRARSSWSWSAR